MRDKETTGKLPSHFLFYIFFLEVVDDLFSERELERLQIDLDSEIANAMLKISSFLSENFGIDNLVKSWHHYDRFNGNHQRECRFHADNFNIAGYQ